MSDLIDRQAAIDALADYIHNVDKVMGTGHLTADDCKDAAASVFEELPSAQPDRKKGKWKETDDGWDGTYYVCSACGCPWTLIDGTPEDNGMNYCPNCGARMVDDDIS